MAKRLGLKFWQKHLESWARSGLTQVAYCLEHGLSVKTFCRWRSKELAAAAKSPALTLVPVSIGVPAPGNAVQLHSPGGWRIELPGSNVAWLGTVLRQLP